MDTVTFPGARVVGARRRLLGIGRAELAQEAGLPPALLAQLEAGHYDPRSLHELARRVLARRLDITLD
ncbi:XRE family transcriptional regulator [Deinococcus sp. HMF7620]|uniref:XRE family transcriptional regulator n=1 Tax=Deinococcus arboris TaxID=2682977 RepID=A0A7C9HQ53_9DEIO|nr:MULTISPECIES: XRE family transcriptional regulator [Deinococcus]MBZ9751222.1 XRE family transcriptional regulator [Deinococcus betulae]MVN85767.1 XRE family transcriptional regulator [Deinococcus arboris]